MVTPKYQDAAIKLRPFIELKCPTPARPYLTLRLNAHRGIRCPTMGKLFLGRYRNTQ